MANEEQLRILKEEGVEAWNKWRREIYYRREEREMNIDLSFANLLGANLREAFLDRVILRGAKLQRGNLQKAYLVHADLEKANFSLADLRGAYLQQADLRGAKLYRANLLGADLREADLRRGNLYGAYLQQADLSEAKLSEADLREVKLYKAELQQANLQQADLQQADLRGTQALRTNFSGATFTGACIQGWNTNSETNLDNVICDYIYLKCGKWNEDKLKYDFLERRPADPNRNFAPGEFAKLVETSIETVDLIFKDGIDWRAFLSSFQDLRVEYGEQKVSIQAIEKKSDGAFVIRLSVPPYANKAEIESKAIQSYETELQVLKAQNVSLLRENANLNNIVQTLASRPIIVEAKAVAENQSKNVEVEMNFQAPVTGAAGKVSGNMNVYASEQKQTLAQAAEEIQQLLQQLEQTNPTATVEQQKAYVDAAIPPSIKERCIGALKAGGETAIEEFLDNPYVNVGKAVVKGWMKPE